MFAERNAALMKSLLQSGGKELQCVDKFMGEDFIAELAEHMKHDKTRNSMTLRGNCIGERGAEALSSMLASNNHLTVISVEWNQLGSRGCAAIARGLEVNISLTALDLRNNGIGDDGAVALSRSLSQNFTLRSLDLRWNEVNL